MEDNKDLHLWVLGHRLWVLGRVHGVLWVLVVVCGLWGLSEGRLLKGRLLLGGVVHGLGCHLWAGWCCVVHSWPHCLLDPMGQGGQGTHFYRQSKQQKQQQMRTMSPLAA